MKIDRAQYKELFKIKGHVSCLDSDLFVHGSLGIAGLVTVNKGRQWRSFIGREGEGKCLRLGLKIFSSPKIYEKYSKDFEVYIKKIKQEDIASLEKRNTPFSISELKKLLSNIQKFWRFYGITEFSYHDMAYQKMLETGNPDLKRNLNHLGKLKLKGRTVLNAYIFKDGVIDRILMILSRQFSISKNDLMYYFKKELFDLYRGKKVNERIIKERREYWGCSFVDNQMSIFKYEKAKSVWNRLVIKPARSQEIRGVIASKGIARGEVVIAPMLTDMKEVRKIEAKMRKGNILVAATTSPELISLCKKAAAIVADEGGMLSHAAVISRELRIPGIVGAGNATLILKDGDLVEVDANKGIVRILK